MASYQRGELLLRDSTIPVGVEFVKQLKQLLAVQLAVSISIEAVPRAALGSVCLRPQIVALSHLGMLLLVFGQGLCHQRKKYPDDEYNDQHHKPVGDRTTSVKLFTGIDV